MSQRILAYGEVMMRLMPQNYKTLTQTHTLDTMLTGTGVNILSGMYQLGHDVQLLTTLPDNRIGKAARADLRKLGIADHLIETSGQHMGCYFLEMGYGSRSSYVTYLDREHSSFALATKENYDYDKALEGVSMIHICGIAFINDTTYETALHLAKEAKKRNITVVFDCNFRPSLWSETRLKKAKKMYEDLLHNADIVFAGVQDTPRFFDDVDITKPDQALSRLREAYDITLVCGTNRIDESIQGFIVDDQGYATSRLYELDVFDRIGGGDGYAMGIMHAYLEGYDREHTLDFATAAGVLAHTTYGDSFILGKQDIDNLVNQTVPDIIR